MSIRLLLKLSQCIFRFKFHRCLRNKGVRALFLTYSIIFISSLMFSPSAYAQGFPAVLDLNNINGANGASITSTADDISPGVVTSVNSVGDINGDGFDDVAVGMGMESPERRGGAGITYIVFGRLGGVENLVSVPLLDGSNGFALIGGSQDQSGTSVSGAGDFNGDGIDDLLIGAPKDDPLNVTSSGSSYIIFGHAGSFDPVINLAALDGIIGFSLIGVTFGEESGRSVSRAGDINGDGIDDVVIGAPQAGTSAGVAYVVFGHTGSFPAVFDLFTLDGSNGFTLIGDDVFVKIGEALSAAGDFNGDGVDDLLVGSSRGVGVGKAHVIFGHTGAFTAELFDVSTLNGANGVTINGLQSHDLAGHSVSGAGDVNGDGVDDIIIGARNIDFQGKSVAGAAFVVFGHTGAFGAEIELADINGTNGFTMFGVTAGDLLGNSVSGAGDINADGFSDVIIGAPNGLLSGQSFDGADYVIYGRSAFSAQFDLTSLDGTNGFAIGGSSGSPFGSRVSEASDVNGDGVDDIFFSGAPNNINFPTIGLATIVYGVDSNAVSAGPTTIFSSVLPAARSGFVGGSPITVFASAVNAGANPAQNCTITLTGTPPVTLNYQLTNAANVPVGPSNATFSFDPGVVKSFILSFTPVATSSGVDVFPNIVCDNASVSAIPGVNTVFLSIGNAAVPDVLSIGATPDANGIITVPAGGISFMSASATNIGVGDTSSSKNAAMTVSVDDGGANLSLLLQLCETDATAACITPLGTGPMNTTIGAGVSFFAVFVSDQASGGIPLDPAGKRVFLRFTDASGTVRSVTSAAVTVP